MCLIKISLPENFIPFIKQINIRNTLFKTYISNPTLDSAVQTSDTICGLK